MKMWLFVERYPKRTSQNIFSFRSQTRTHLSLNLRTDGKLELLSSMHPEAGAVIKIPFTLARWTHITLIHRPARGADPTLRMQYF
jgi:hypothetical protein